MNPDDNNPNETYNSSIQDAQGHWYSHAISPDPPFHTTSTSSTPSTIEHDMQIDQQMSHSTTQTICVSTDTDNDDSHNEAQQQMTSTLSQEWLPPATSTPLPTIAVAASNSSTTRRSEREIENDLFQNIENLVREFLRRPNREYPYYRVIRWTLGEQPKLEYLLTVVINRPSIILE